MGTCKTVRLYSVMTKHRQMNRNLETQCVSVRFLRATLQKNHFLPDRFKYNRGHKLNTSERILNLFSVSQPLIELVFYTKTEFIHCILYKKKKKTENGIVDCLVL